MKKKNLVLVVGIIISVLINIKFVSPVEGALVKGKLIYFTSSMCQSCKEQTKILEELKKEAVLKETEILVVDINRDGEKARELGWKVEQGVPTIFIVRNDKTEVLEGLHFKNQVIDALKGVKKEVIQFEVGKKYYLKNKVSHNMDVETVVVNNRAYVPLRYLAVSLGVKDSDVKYNQGNIDIYAGNMKLGFVLGKNTISVNGSIKEIDAIPFSRNNRTYIPARYLAEQLGYKVDWANNKVIIERESMEKYFSSGEVITYNMVGKKCYRVDDMLIAGGLDEVIYDAENVIKLPKNYRYAGIILTEGSNAIYLVDWQGNGGKYDLSKPIIKEGGSWYVQEDENAVRVGMLAELVK